MYFDKILSDDNFKIEIKEFSVGSENFNFNQYIYAEIVFMSSQMLFGWGSYY